VFVARGDDPIDAAAGIPAAALANASIVLVLTDDVPASVDEVLAMLGTDSITVLGGTGAISTQTEVDLAEHLD
jgi:putative cell wall-binding protein